MALDPPGEDPRLGAGDPAFRRAALALFFAGLTTFALLYSPQALLPLLARDLDVSPATSTLALAAATLGLGVGLFPASVLADRLGRAVVLRWSLWASAALGLACALAPGIGALLALRLLQGLALGGVPGVAMAYLATEIRPEALGRAVGRLIGGNAIGGMTGRLVTGFLAEAWGWRVALAAIGLSSAGCAFACVRLLPPERAFRPRRTGVLALARGVGRQLVEPGLRRLDLVAALLMGAFVAVFNGLGFRLEAAPYGLGPASIALVFLVYPLGSVASASAGRWADTVGRRAVLPVGLGIALAGVALTLAAPLALVVLGVACLTVGFFIAHSVASSWVGRRGGAEAAQASALYLLAYYGGASLGGPAAGIAWAGGAWPAVAGLAGALLLVALGISELLRRTPPLVRVPGPVPAAAAP